MNKSIVIGVVVFVAFVALLIWLAGEDEKEAVGPQNDGTAMAERAVSDADHAKGPADAPVTIVEYSDFQCPACASYAPLVKELLADNANTVRFVYRHYPLQNIHPNAFSAARAAEAAAMQGKFWEMHDVLFERQSSWSSATRPKEIFTTYAQELALDAAQFSTDYDSDAVTEKVRADLGTAQDLNLTSTPSFTLNGEQIDSPRSLQEFQALVDAAGGDAADTMEEPEAMMDDAADAMPGGDAATSGLAQ